jgi:hypothetical protein
MCRKLVQELNQAVSYASYSPFFMSTLLWTHYEAVINNLWSEFSTSLWLKITGIWDLTSCWQLICYQRFVGACCPHFRGSPRRISFFWFILQLTFSQPLHLDAKPFWAYDHICLILKFRFTVMGCHLRWESKTVF